MTHFRFAASLLALLVSGSSYAAADTFFDFSFSGASFSGAGVFDTVVKGPDSYSVKGVSGTVDTGNGVPRSIDNVLDAGSFENNDNLLFFPARPDDAFFDGQGVSFSLLNGAKVNLYSSNGAYLVKKNGDLASEIATISVAPEAASPVPEPGSLGLLVTGTLAVAAFARQRR